MTVGLSRGKKISNLLSFLFVSEDAAQSAANAESEIGVQIETIRTKEKLFALKTSQVR